MELAKLLKDDGSGAPTTLVLPDDLDVKSVDLSDHTALAAIFDVVKAAYGPAPPNFDAWKVHYAQQPRFAPEFSFVAWKRDDATPVAVIVLERLVDGEDGGENEIGPVRATHGKLLAHKKATEKASANANADTAAYKSDDETQRLLDVLSNDKLVFSSDFHDRKLKTTEVAMSAYVFGAATLPEYRGKGIAGGLLQLAFHEATKSPSLERVVLGTDIVNTSAVRAYKRAGMVETKRYSTGEPMLAVKEVSFAQP